MTAASPAAASPPTNVPHPPRRSLKKNIFYAVLGMGVFNLCQAGVMVLLAKFATPEIMGAFNYGIALSSPYVLFFALQLRGVLTSDTTWEFTYGTYRALRTLGTLAAALVIAGLLVWEARTTPSAALLIIVAGVCAGKIVWSFVELCWGLFQKRERLDLLAWSNILRGVGILLPFTISVPLYYFLTTRGSLAADRLADGAAWACVAHAVLWLAVYWFFDLRCVKSQSDHDLSWTWAAVWQLMLRALPLGFVTLIINLCDSIPRWMIANHHGGKEGLSSLGYYSALTYITTASSLLIIQAGQAAANRLSVYYQTNMPAFLWLFGKLTGMAVAAGAALLAGAWLLGEWFLGVLYTADYARYYQEFLIVVFAQCLALLINVFGIATTQMRLFWTQVPLQLTVLASVLVAGWLLIPRDPVGGGARTYIVRTITQLVLYTACVAYGIWHGRRKIVPKNAAEDGERGMMISN